MHIKGCFKTHSSFAGLLFVVAWFILIDGIMWSRTARKSQLVADMARHEVFQDHPVPIVLPVKWWYVFITLINTVSLWMMNTVSWDRVKEHQQLYAHVEFVVHMPMFWITGWIITSFLCAFGSVWAVVTQYNRAWSGAGPDASYEVIEAITTAQEAQSALMWQTTTLPLHMWAGATFIVANVLILMSALFLRFQDSSDEDDDDDGFALYSMR